MIESLIVFAVTHPTATAFIFVAIAYSVFFGAMVLALKGV